METMDKTQRFSRTIPCSTCGEMYSITYKRCPFCGGKAKHRPDRPKPMESVGYERELEASFEEDSSRPSGGDRGGKRLKKDPSASFGRFLLYLLSLAVIVAAAYIVVTKVVPIVQSRLSEGQGPAVVDPVGNEGEDEGEDQGAGDPAAKFRLLDIQVTLTAAGESKQLEAVYDPQDKLGEVTWTSSNPSVVAVSNSGRLTAVSPGTAIITATREGEETAQCEVTCLWESESLTSDIYLNRTDFTLNKGDSCTMKVIGTEETPQWTIEDIKVATVSETGVVKYVGKGTTKVIATVGGKTLSSIVRCTG